MSKSILVIDTPDSCSKCKIRFDDEYSNWCPYDNPEPNGVWQYVENGTKPNWCPLKPLPDKRDENGIWTMNGYIEDKYSDGYNACIDEILGGN